MTWKTQVSNIFSHTPIYGWAVCKEMITKMPCLIQIKHDKMQVFFIKISSGVDLQFISMDHILPSLKIIGYLQKKSLKLLSHCKRIHHNILVKISGKLDLPLFEKVKKHKCFKAVSTRVVSTNFKRVYFFCNSTLHIPRCLL